MTLQKKKESLQAFIKAREAATQGEWEYIGDDSHSWNIKRVGSAPEEGVEDITNGGVVGCSEWIWLPKENAEFIALAANQSADMARDLIRALEVIKFYADEKNWTQGSLSYLGTNAIRSDLSITENTYKNEWGHFPSGGKRAREFLNSLSAEEGV